MPDVGDMRMPRFDLDEDLEMEMEVVNEATDMPHLDDTDFGNPAHQSPVGSTNFMLVQDHQASRGPAESSFPPPYVSCCCCACTVLFV